MIILKWCFLSITMMVIFDLDQTLVDTLHRFHVCFNELLKRHGLRELDWKEFVESYSADELDKYVPDCIDVEEFWREFRRMHCSRRHQKDRLYEGVHDVLRYLKERGFRIVIITGRECSEEELWDELRAFGIDKYVDYACSFAQIKNEDFLWSKKGMIEHVMRKFSVSPDEVIFIADYWMDMRSARELGVRRIAVLTGLEPKERLLLNGAEEIIEGIWELPKVIR